MTQKLTELINSDKPVLIDFFCRMVRPLQGDGAYTGRTEE